MMSDQDHSIGNPVDAWWMAIRREIDLSIMLLGQFPPAPSSNAAENLIPSVVATLQIIQQVPFPPQAGKIRNFLLDSLIYLIQSLKEQAEQGLMAPQTSYNIAYHKYLMVMHYLLQRGIYEPEPRKYNKLVAR